MKRVMCCALLIAVLVCSISVALAAQGDIRDYTTISRSNPVRAGEIASFMYTENEMGVTLCVTDVKRGKEALAVILDANEFNDKPKSGQQVVVATIHATMQCSADDRLELDWMDFEYVTSDGVADYATFYAGIKSDLKLYSGGSGNLLITFVTDNDDAPLLLFQGDIWMSLEE